MEKYIWESEYGIHDVLDNFSAVTDKPNAIDRILFDYKSFNYKSIGAEAYQFTLWFHFAWSSASYHPAPIKGIITSTARGCRILVHPQRWVTIVDSILLLTFLAILYISTIAAPIAGFMGWITVSSTFGVIATSMLIRFMYTRKKWLSENALLNIIDCASSASRQQL